MPDKNLPPDWSIEIFSTLSNAIAGALGAFVRQMCGSIKKISKMALEWICGAACAIYGAEISAHAIYHFLGKYDLIDKTITFPEKFVSLAGFLCGAIGIVVLDSFIRIFKKKVRDS